jgi:hypothetical protein
VSTGSAEDEGAHRTLSDGSVVRATKADRPTERSVPAVLAGGRFARVHCLINNAAQTVRPAAATARAPPECLASLVGAAHSRPWLVRAHGVARADRIRVGLALRAGAKCNPKQIPNRTHSPPLRLRASAAATTARTRRLRSLRAFRCARLDRFRAVSGPV